MARTSGNVSLGKAKVEKYDEFYTRYDDIQNELNHYEEHFKGKTVLCNCDDPFESNFCKFFLRNFNYLKLKRLICTSYVTSPVVGTQMTIFDYLGEPVQRGNGYVMDISEVPMANGRGVTDDDIDKLLRSKKRGVKKLEGNGDFRSDECIEYLKQADIVVTNPPFSLFRDYISLLIEHKKKFLIIGNQNALHYKEIFPLIQNNEIWVGYKRSSGGGWYTVTKEYENDIRSNKKKATWKEVEGSFLVNCPMLWYTNLDIKKRHEDLILYKKYSADEYPKFDNFDAINVNKVCDIPCDYYGYMGVPDGFIEIYNPEQFEIIGRSGDTEWVLNECDFFTPPSDEKKEFYKHYNKTWRVQNGYLLNENKLPVIVYSRIFIRRRGNKQ